MGHLRAAVERQRGLIIKRLIQTGAVDHKDAEIYNKTITELVEEYKEYTSKQNIHAG